jgi:hypothetical protein
MHASKKLGNLPGMRARKKPDVRLRFNVDAWDRLAATIGLRTNAEKARFLGIDESNYSRVTRGETEPGIPFVGRVVRATRDHGGTFETLFLVENTDAIGAAA